MLRRMVNPAGTPPNASLNAASICLVSESDQSASTRTACNGTPRQAAWVAAARNAARPCGDRSTPTITRALRSAFTATPSLVNAHLQSCHPALPHQGIESLFRPALPSPRGHEAARDQRLWSGSSRAATLPVTRSEDGFMVLAVGYRGTRQAADLTERLTDQ